MAEAPKWIFTTRDRWSVPLKYVLDILQSEEAFTVAEYKYTHTHKHEMQTANVKSWNASKVSH